MATHCQSCREEHNRLYLVIEDGERRFVCRRCEDRIDKSALRASKTE